MNTIFITGSSSGIGLETTKIFAKNGWKVIATMRNIAKGEALAQLTNVEVVRLDVSNHEEIKQVVADVLAKLPCRYRQQGPVALLHGFRMPEAVRPVQ